MATSPPRLNSTTPIALIEAFLARQHQSSENTMQAARKLEQQPMEYAMQEARDRFRSKLALENIPLEARAREPFKIAEEERADKRARSLLEARSGEAVKTAGAAATARVKALQELYRSDPEAFRAVQSRTARTPDAGPQAGEGEELAILPNSDFDRDELVAEMEKRGLYLQKTEPYKGKNVGRFGPKATRAWTDPPASRAITESPAPAPAKPTSPQAKDAIPDSGELSPQSRAITDGILNQGGGKSDKRSSVQPDPQSGGIQEPIQTASAEIPDEDFMIRGLYDALRKNKYSDKGARVMLAHVGRENDFNPEHIFGSHSDPHNGANNVGFFSWQKDRGAKLLQELEAAGLRQEGRIKPSQAALEIMARHSTDEMRQMSPQLLEYLQGDDVDPNRASDSLSRRYIKWRHDDPTYASHHKRMQDWYGRVNKSIVPQVRATADPDIFDVLTEDIFGVG